MSSFRDRLRGVRNQIVDKADDLHEKLNTRTGVIRKIETSDREFNFITINVGSKSVRVHTVKDRDDSGRRPLKVGEKVTFEVWKGKDYNYKGTDFASVSPTN